MENHHTGNPARVLQLLLRQGRQSRQSLATALGLSVPTVAQCAAEHFDGEFDAITWVPVSKKRLKKRGFDQARYLTASICVDWHTEPLETLRKVVDNPAQSGIDSPEERRANVLGVYEAVEPERFAGKRLLLIDDIRTTGATLGECVRVLKEAGAKDVLCLTLAAGERKK